MWMLVAAGANAGMPQPTPVVSARVVAAADAAVDDAATEPPRGCQTFAVQPIEPVTPFPGVTLYPEPGSRETNRGNWFTIVPHPSPSNRLAWAMAKSRDREDDRFLLVSLRGGPAKLISGDVEFSGLALNSFGTSLLIVKTSKATSCGQGIHAFDPTTLTRVWSQTKTLKGNPKWENARWPAAYFSSPGLLAIRFFQYHKPTSPLDKQEPLDPLAVLDADNGRIRWQKDVPVDSRVATLGTRLITHSGIEGGILTSFDSERGAGTAFGDALDNVLAADITANWLGVLHDKPDPHGNSACVLELRILDATTGVTQHRLELGTHECGTIRTLKLDAGSAYVEAPAQSLGFDASEIRAFDLQSGRQRWRSRVFPCGSGYTFIRSVETSLQTATERVYACTCDGVLHGLRVRDGSIALNASVGRCGRTVVSNDSLAASFAQTPPVVGIIDLKVRPAPANVTIRGRVVPARGAKVRFPRWVRVGSDLIRTDGSGRFQHEFRGVGVVSVDAPCTKAEHLVSLGQFVDLMSEKREVKVEIQVFSTLKRLGWGDGPGALFDAATVPPAVEVKLGAPRITGPLPPDVIQRVVRRAYGQIRACYQAEMAHNSQLRVGVVLRFVIDLQGKVTRPQTLGVNSSPDVKSDSCVHEVLSALVFPKPAGDSVTVEFPLIAAPR